MEAQARKLNFIEEYLRITNEHILNTLDSVLKTEKIKEISAKMKPMSLQDLQLKLDRSEQDIKEGKIYSQDEVELHFKTKKHK